jgi:outer membrane lipoprotein-sorting protein
MGDNYRVETSSQTIITDGLITWVYNSIENQLIINDYEEDETTFSISDFFFSFDEKYSVREVRAETIGGARHHVLALTPLDEGSFFTDVTLWVRASDSIITKLQVLDANETTMNFDLNSIVINPEVAADAFSFTPADDTDVVDLRS